MSLSLRMTAPGPARADFGERWQRANTAHEEAIRRLGEDLKQALRAQLAGVASAGRNRGRGQDIAKTWSSRFYANRRSGGAGGVSSPASLVYSGAPSIVHLLAEGGVVHPRRAKYLVVALPAAVALGLDRLMSDRGGGARFRKASDIAGALATLGRLHRIVRRDGTIVLAIERRRFRAAGGGRFGALRGQLIPIFLLVKTLSFRRKINPDSLARAMAERLPDYINEELGRTGIVDSAQ